jgi:replicative DNA helicase
MEKRLDLIVVDYLQLLRTKRPSSSRTQDVTEISRDLKLLAGELQVPVIALSQFSREAAKGPPELHHLRESGSIEQDADWVLFCYADKDVDGQNYRMISLAKNRRGARVPAFSVGFDGPCVRFSERTI